MDHTKPPFQFVARRSSNRVRSDKYAYKEIKATNKRNPVNYLTQYYYKKNTNRSDLQKNKKNFASSLKNKLVSFSAKLNSFMSGRY